MRACAAPIPESLAAAAASRLQECLYMDHDNELVFLTKRKVRGGGGAGEASGTDTLRAVRNNNFFGPRGTACMTPWGCSDATCRLPAGARAPA